MVILALFVALFVALQRTKTVVEYSRKDEIVQAGSHRMKSADLTVYDLDPERPEIKLDAGQMGMDRFVSINVQPLDDHFSVVWNGDLNEPILRFDGYPNPCRIRVDAWGR